MPLADDQNAYPKNLRPNTLATALLLSLTLRCSFPYRRFSNAITRCPAFLLRTYTFAPSGYLTRAHRRQVWGLPRAVPDWAGTHRRPFRHKARSPQVRTQSFPAQPPDLRCRPLTTRASRFIARSPWSTSPYIRFLFIGSRFRFTLPPHTRSPSCSCASLRSLWSAYGRTFTCKIAPMLGAQQKKPVSSDTGFFLIGIYQV